MNESALVLASHLESSQPLLPDGNLRHFLGALLDYARIEMWFASALALAAASWLLDHLLPLKIRVGTAAGIPNGPSGLPVLGSILALRSYPERTFDRWAKHFGPIFSVWLGSQLFVVVSDPGIAKGLMATHGAVFSDRKEMFIESQTVFRGRGIVASPYNRRWRKHRRIASLWLDRKAVESYTHALEFEAIDMINHLFTDGADGMADINPQAYVNRCSLNNMLTITFGFRTDSIRHPMLAQVLRLSRNFSTITRPVSNLVGFVPIMQKLPSDTRRRARKLHSELLELYGGLIREMEKSMQAGAEVQDCLVQTMLLRKTKEDLDDLDITMLASGFMLGGTEPTASIMQWCTALIPAHPHVQKRAQEELDRVVGRDRLPTAEDVNSLPYCRAVIKEVERCHNPLWLGTPHMASQDFVYGEHRIPKGTVVVLNTWTMHHDPKRWKNPMDFDPDRYVHEQLHSSASPQLPSRSERDHWIFGAGRRICPGMLVAEREIWLTISRMLWAFDMQQIPDKPIDLNEYDGESGTRPRSFEVRLRPRFEGARKVVEEEIERWNP